MCACGKKYKRLIDRIISKGIFGYNVVLNIFSDNDKDFNKKGGNEDTTLEYYQMALAEYTILFKEVNIYYNLVAKDYGTSLGNIRLKKHHL
jgi:hypothetical protein